MTGLRTLFAWPDGYHVLIGLVSPGGELCGASLAGLDLRRHGLLVLAIGRQGRQVHFPKGREILHPGDCLLLYGSPETWRA